MNIALPGNIFYVRCTVESDFELPDTIVIYVRYINTMDKFVTHTLELNMMEPCVPLSQHGVAFIYQGVLTDCVKFICCYVEPPYDEYEPVY